MVALATGAALSAALGLALPLSLVGVLRRLHAAVGIAPPTEEMLAQEDTSACALFRHLPELAPLVAWRSLGANRQTPVHECSLTSPLSGDKVRFLVKREDTISPLYGGNKVRTLQHQLATCEARARTAPTEHERSKWANLLVLGSGGSNQVVATALHASNVGLPPVTAAWADEDLPDLDNSLNMLSSLSLPLSRHLNWGQKLPLFAAIGAALLPSALAPSTPLPIGGNNVAGVLGQVSGALELAEQIQAGATEDPRAIYLPVGSGCTISGLVLGVTLARHLQLRAFCQPDFEIVGVIVHHVFAKVQAVSGLHSARWAAPIPLTARHSVATAAATLVELGGPDITKEAMRMLETQVRFITDPHVVGIYGGHSEASLAASRAYDASGSVTVRAADGSTTPAPHLWLCGHFAAKAVAVLLQDAEASRTSAGAAGTDETTAPQGLQMLWQTKSMVQPRGDADEWSAMCAMPDVVREWADKGQAMSSLRPGSVNTRGGSADDYRGLMRTVTLRKPASAS